jgi:hypothetical protein
MSHTVKGSLGRGHWLIAALLCSFVLSTTARSQDVAPPRSQVSLEEVRVNVEKLRARLDGSLVYIKYRVKLVKQVERAVGAPEWEETTFAMKRKDNKFYCDHRCSFNKQVLHRKSAFDGQVGTNLTGNNGDVLDRPIGVYWLDVYLQRLGFPYRPNDLKRATDDREERSWLPHAFARQPYRVLDEQELVDGDWCHVVVAPESDKLWLAAKRGFVVKQREFRWAPGKPMRVRIRNLDLEEVKPGLWLPQRSVAEYYGPLDEPRETGKVILTQTLHVEKLEIDPPLPDSFFRLTFPPGTYVIDAIKKGSYRVPPELKSGSGDR